MGRLLSSLLYCGVHCDHGAGFIYYTAPLKEQEAMEKAGFEYINANAEEEYSNGGESARIQKIRKYKNGFLLYYVITGAA